MKDRMGDNCKDYSYSLIDKINIKKSSLFWYFVDRFSCKLDKLAELYEKTISGEYRREAKIFDISDSKNILHIGCGAYPISTMTLAETNGGKITGIDRNLKDVELAKEIIKKKKLEDKVQIDHGDGTDYPVDNFDTIIISGCSIPKINILKHIFQTAKPNTKIIVREAHTTSNATDNFINSCKNIRIIKRIENHPFASSRWESFYLLKA